jgi:zinc/manganese transport system substrate-binding protein
MRTVLVLATAAALAAGCGGSPQGGPLRVVASTNVWGDVAAQIGGTDVAVTSILSDPNADPHLFEAGTRNGLAVAQAGVVVENGAGYDAFMDRLLSSTASKARVVDVAGALGQEGTGANPHFWYDVPELPRIAAAIAAGLRAADPAHAAGYRARLARFVASLGPLRREVARIRARFARTPVAYTEPVPGYLVAAAGLENVAPAQFTRALQDGSEPPPDAVAAMQTLLARGMVRALLYNSQAVSPITVRLRDQARANGIPVVGVTETLPRGLRFQQWQLRQARALEAALSR